MKFAVASDHYTPLYIDSIYYIRTADGGDTWMGGTIPMGFAPLSSNIAAISSTSAWASGLDAADYTNYILRTDDGGANWTRQLEDGFSSASSYIDFVHFWDSQNGIAVGDPAVSDTDTIPFFEIYKTSDGGDTWNRVSSANIPASQNEYGLGGVYQVVGDNVWFGTINPDYSGLRIFHSIDRGATWTAVNTPAVFLLSFADELHGIAFDYNTRIPRYTSDGGATWTDLPETTAGIGVSEMVMIPQSHYLLMVQANEYIVGPFRTLISNDLGQTWVEISTGEHAGNVAFASPTVGYGGEWQPTGHKNRMYKYTGSPLVGLFSGLELDARVTLSSNPASDFLQVQIEVASHPVPAPAQRCSRPTPRTQNHR